MLVLNQYSLWGLLYLYLTNSQYFFVGRLGYAIELRGHKTSKGAIRLALQCIQLLPKRPSWFANYTSIQDYFSAIINLVVI